MRQPKHTPSPVPATAFVTFLLDRSGSMASILDDTIGGFNTYLERLQAGDTGTLFTLLTFDSTSLDKLAVAVPVRDVEKLSKRTFVPRDGTPLIDAAHKTIEAVDAAAQRHPGARIVVAILTDGHENASREHGWADLAELVKAKRAAGWEFIFMGAGIDAYDQAARMGIGAANTVSYDKASAHATRATFAATAQNTQSFARGQSASAGYTVGQKHAAGDKYDPGAKMAATPPARPKAVDDFSL